MRSTRTDRNALIKGMILPTVQACHGCELRIGSVILVFGSPRLITSFEPHVGLKGFDGTYHTARVAVWNDDETGLVTVFDTDVFIDQGDGVWVPRHLAAAPGTAEATAALTDPRGGDVKA